MMGGHHAACGAAAWVAVTTQFHLPLSALRPWWPPVPDAVPVGWGLLEVTPLGVAAGALVCAGAALLPDADHRHASVAQSLPPVSNRLCALLGRLAGGHRNGTHTVFGIAAFTAAAWVAGLWTVPGGPFGTLHPGAGLVAVVLSAFAFKALRFIPDSMRRLPWLVALPAGAFVALCAPDEQYWFVLAVALGAAVHIAGDLLTDGGCNLLWPLRVRAPRAVRRVPLLRAAWRRSGRVALPVLGRAGSWREWLVCVPVSAYAFGGIVVPLWAATRQGAATALTLLSGAFG